MKLKYFLPMIIFFMNLDLNGQTPVLNFDGTDDYVNVGLAANGARTIELWFKPSVEINNSLDEFSTLVSREISLSDNTNEFVICFQPNYASNSGQLRFDIDGTAPFKSIYSNDNIWVSGRWYHLAVVIDPVDGMKMFIDGIQQLDTHPYNEPIATVSNETLIGEWGAYNRFFNGCIDDVRFSENAVYTENFTPPCPDLLVESGTIALWNFNENSGTTVEDATTNDYDGTIYGASWELAEICEQNGHTGIEKTNADQSFSVFPNPSSGIFYADLGHSEGRNKIEVYDAMGRLVIKQNTLSRFEMIDLVDQETGTYYVKVISDTGIRTEQLIKL